MKKILLVLAIMFSPMFFMASADAARQAQVSDVKAALEGLYGCYNDDNDDKVGFDPYVTVNEYKYSNSEYYKNLSLITTAGRSVDDVPLPNGHYKNDSINCQDVMIGEEGYSGDLFPGLSSMYNFSIPNDDAISLTTGVIGEFYESMGYIKNEREVESNETTMCFNLPYSSEFVGETGTIVLDDAKYTHYACIEVDKDTHIIKKDATWHVTEGPSGDTFDSVYWTTKPNEPDKYAQLTINVKYAFLGSGWTLWGLLEDDATSYISEDDTQTIEDFANGMYQKSVEIGGAAYSMSKYYYPGIPQYFQPPVGEKEVVIAYELKKPRTDSAETAMDKITSGLYPDYDALEFSSDEVFDLYMDYLKNYYNSDNVTIYCGANSNTAEASYYEGKVGAGEYIKFSIKTASDPSGKVCYASAPTRNKDKKVHGVNPSTMHFDGTPVSVTEMLSALDNMQIEDEIPDSYLTPPGTVGPGAQDGEEDKCYGGAGVLGWIVCPVMSGLADLGSSAYKWIEENFLQVRASIFSEDKNGVRDAWETIRNVANLGFIILLLIVIISQVTGYGIDNYGIKRILPKLIVGAIIMNLSYIICELMIDASNIAGSGLKDMLDGMGSGLDSKLLASNESYKASGGQYAEVFGAGIIATAISMILSSGTVGAVLMLFVALLSVVISILVLFVVLIIRQAGVVVCVVIAPIAIACYLLPNTEKYFKKWLDLMKGLLIVYPLCGLIIGAGDFLGKIFGNLAVESVGNLQMGFALSAMVVTAIPYLFIPTLLRSSLAAMGNLGAKISGLGAKLRGGASKKIKNSDAMKNSRERAGEFRTRIKAGVDRNGNDKQLGRFRRALRGGKRGMARARAQYLKNRDTRNREDNLMGVGFMAAQVAQEKKATADEVANELTLLKSETNDGADENKVIETFNDSMEKANKALAEGNGAEASKYINKARAAVQLAGRRKDTAARFAEATLLNDKKQYNSALLGKIAKDISEGETSKSYRSGSPFAFEYASRLNDGTAVGADGKTPAKDFADWLANPDNVHNALNRHVATSEDLMSVQGANLRQMADMIKARKMDGKDAEYLRTLSQKAIIAHKEKGASFDYSKAEWIYRLAYGDAEYLDKMKADGIGELSESGAGASTVTQVDDNATGAAKADETFNTRTPQQPAFKVSVKRVAISPTRRPQTPPQTPPQNPPQNPPQSGNNA